MHRLKYYNVFLRCFQGGKENSQEKKKKIKEVLNKAASADGEGLCFSRKF